tara:strand:- start:212 stop:877 length:666 start_codon:yes stop_codon:yes gene_type:complete
MSSWDILILDKSASMIENKKSLIDGFNDLVLEQQKEKSSNLFTVVMFNHEVDLFKEDKFENFRLFKNSDILPKGTTALYDAIGTVYDIILQNDTHKNITLTVITDGMENSSKIYTTKMLNNMKKDIDKKCKINMTFIGTDMSCIDSENITSHASQSVNCRGDLNKALKIASRTMSSQREETDYVPEGIVISNPVTPLVMKRSRSSNSFPPKIKRCRSICDL